MDKCRQIGDALKFKVGDLIYLEDDHVAIVLGEGNWKGWIQVYVLSETFTFDSRCQVSEDRWEKL